MNQGLRRVDWTGIVACVAIPLFFMLPMFVAFPAVDGHRVLRWVANQNLACEDAAEFAQVWEAARVSILRYHQFPSWDPWMCGGEVLFQNPDTPFPGPVFLLTAAWLPTFVALKIWQLAHLVAGAFGMRRLARDAGANRPEQWLAITIATATGFVSYALGAGRISFGVFALMPWALWTFRRSFVDPRWAVLVAGVLALMLYEGGIYPLPITAVVLAFETIAHLSDARDRRALVVTLPVIAVLAPLLSAARLLPVVSFLERNPRLVPLDDHLSIADLFEMWTARHHGYEWPGHSWDWTEYGDYVGIVPVVLVLLGVAIAIGRTDALRRSRRVDLAVFGLVLWMTLGNIPSFSLYAVLHLAPIYRSLRVPSRYIDAANVLMALVAISPLVVWRGMIDEHRLRPGLRRAFIAFECTLALGVLIDASRTSWPNMVPASPVVLGPDHVGGPFHHDGEIDHRQLARTPSLGIGTAACEGGFGLGAPDALRTGAVPQAWLEPADAGRVVPRSWSPNELQFHVEATRPAWLVVNQNADADWNSDLGTTTARAELLAVRVPAGRHDARLWHRSRWLPWGILITLGGLALSVLLVRWLEAGRIESMRRRIAILVRSEAR